MDTRSSVAFEYPPQQALDEIAARAALVASDRRARALFEGIDDSVFVHDMDGKILDANPAACRRLGYSRDEFLRLNTRDIDDASFAEGYRDRLAEQLLKGHLHCEGRHRTKDGRVFPVDINTSTVNLEDKQVVVAVIRDITERKALEASRACFAEAQAKHAREMEEKNRELSLSEERYRKLTEGLLDAVVVTDAEARIMLFNPSAEQIFGYESAEILGQPFGRLFSDCGKDLQQVICKCDPDLVGHTVELVGRRKSGETFPLELSLSTIETGDGVQFVGSIRDQAERQKMRAMLSQSEKLASIGLLSAGVAHEINNPLAFIANNLAVLERDMAGIFAMISAYEAADRDLERSAAAAMERVKQAREDLDWEYVRENIGRMVSRTREGVGRVASIVQTLRGLARTTPPKLESTSLGILIAGAVELVQARMRRANIELVLPQNPAANDPVFCVTSQISQVVLNLLVNAVQAIESIGRSEGNRITIEVRKTPSHHVLEISDTGAGIPEDSLANIFDPFYTTKPVGEGTGLGLSISHGIVTGHGGQIEVESSSGAGTTFRIWLPDRK